MRVWFAPRRLFLVSVAFTLTLTLIPVSSAAATQRVWITELSAVASASGGNLQMAKLPAVAKQQVDTTGGVQSSAAFNRSTNFIRVVCEVQCAITATGTATVTDLLLPAYTPEYFGVQPGGTISVIAAP